MADLRHRWTWLALALLVVGCSSPKVLLESTERPFKDGWQWNRAEGDIQAPRYCIAHSGGGLRSAAFSLGVISELADNGDLDRAQIISAVSGGSYALSAVLAHHFHAYRETPPSVPLSEVVRSEAFQARVTGFGQFITADEMWDWSLESLGAFFHNLWENGIFGRHTNTTTMQFLYRERICSTFQANAPFADCYQSHAIPLERLGDHARSHKLPYYILLGTAALQESENAKQHRLPSIVFEFTPSAYGSDALGRHKYLSANVGQCGSTPDAEERALCLPDAIAISGAAVDSTFISDLADVGVTGRKLLSALNQDLGWNIANPGVSAETRAKRRWIPVPFYFGELDSRGVTGTHFWLTDGGHSDNLGAFSLIRRSCDRIIVVDGEQDPNYLFDGYSKLKGQLERLSWELKVPDIDKALDPALKLEDALKNGKINADVYSAKKQERREELQRRFALKPIMNGTVVTDEPHALRLTYLKLAYQCDSLLDETWPLGKSGHTDGDAADDGIKTYACRSANRINSMWQGTFPHESTADLDYSPQQMRAYVELGRRIARQCNQLVADTVGPGSCFRQ